MPPPQACGEPRECSEQRDEPSGSRRPHPRDAPGGVLKKELAEQFYDELEDDFEDQIHRLTPHTGKNDWQDEQCGSNTITIATLLGGASTLWLRSFHGFVVAASRCTQRVRPEGHGRRQVTCRSIGRGHRRSEIQGTPFPPRGSCGIGLVVTSSVPADPRSAMHPPQRPVPSDVMRRSTALIIAACACLVVITVLGSRMSASPTFWWAFAFGPPAGLALVGLVTDRRIIVRSAALLLVPVAVIGMMSDGFAVLVAIVLLLAASNKQKWRQDHFCVHPTA